MLNIYMMGVKIHLMIGFQTAGWLIFWDQNNYIYKKSHDYKVFSVHIL
jgi:hypothetical protein